MCCGYVGCGRCVRWVGCDVELVGIGVWGIGGVGGKDTVTEKKHDRSEKKTIF
jgi:hypothetical protein